MSTAVVISDTDKFHSQVFHLYNKVNCVKQTKGIWDKLSPELRREINEKKRELRGMLDPGELDCYAYSVGMGIDAIMSNDAGAREIIRYESDDQKVVMNFAQLLILGANLGNFTMSEAEKYYEQVKHRNRLNNLANFNHQVSIFNTYTVKHPWVRNNYPSLYR